MVGPSELTPLHDDLGTLALLSLSLLYAQFLLLFAHIGERVTIEAISNTLRFRTYQRQNPDILGHHVRPSVFSRFVHAVSDLTFQGRHILKVFLSNNACRPGKFCVAICHTPVSFRWRTK